jgi:hypothetical protein
VLNSGDVLLRRLLFFGLFVPLGARWSIDATRRAELRESVATLGSLALLAQVVLVYVVNAAAKVHGGLWLEGEAVAYVLHLDRFSVFLGPVIADVAPLATTLTWLWFGLLLVSWLLLVTTGMYRGILAAAVAGMHAGMVLTMDLGVFPFVSIAALLPFVHGAVWDRIEDRLPAGATEWRSTVGQSSNSRSALSRRVPSIGRFHTGVHAVVLVGLLLVTAMGVGLVPAPDGAPEDVSETSWRMFANPPTQDEWLVAVGTFGDGRRTDLLRDGPVRLDRPPDTGRFPNARWRKHLSRYGARTPFPAALADYQCRRYADEELTRVRLVQASRPATRADGRVQTTDLGDFRCAGDGAVRRDDER